MFIRHRAVCPASITVPVLGQLRVWLGEDSISAACAFETSADYEGPVIVVDIDRIKRALITSPTNAGPRRARDAEG